MDYGLTLKDELIKELREENVGKCHMILEVEKDFLNR